MKDLSLQLREYRAAAGLSQDELAGRLHVTRQAVSHWETGRSEPDLETLTKLAQELGTDTAALLGESRKASSPSLLLHPWFEPLALGVPCLLMLLNDLVTSPLHNPNFGWSRLYLYAYIPLMYGLLGAFLACIIHRLTKECFVISGKRLRTALLIATLSGYALFFYAVWVSGPYEPNGLVAVFLEKIRAVYIAHDWTRLLFPTLAGGLLWLSLHPSTIKRGETK